MRMVWADDVTGELAFAERAAKHFAEHEKISTFTDAEIEPGCLFALRWGFGGNCVVVLKLDENHIPTNYQELVNKFKEDK